MHKSSSLLIGLVGSKGSGKSTAADALVKSRDAVCLPFAGKLKAMLKTLEIPSGCLNNPLFKDRKYHLLGDKTPRFCMQTLGDWGRNIHPDFWIWQWQFEALEGIKMGNHIVVDDVRFPNEARAVKGLGGKLIRIERDLSKQTLDLHPSEVEQATIPVDITFHNNKSERALHYAIKTYFDLLLEQRTPA